MATFWIQTFTSISTSNLLKKASGRLRFLQRMRFYLTTKAARLIYIMMIVPIITAGCTLKSHHTTLPSLDCFPSIVEEGKLLDQMTPLESLPNRKRCLFVKKCLLQKMTDAFNQYFKTLHHSMNTRNNNISLKIQPAKLEIFKTTFLFFFLVLLYITVYRVIFIK